MSRQTAGVIACVAGFSIAIMAAGPSHDSLMDQPIVSAEQSATLIHDDQLNLFRERREEKDEVFRRLVYSEISLADAVRENIRINQAYPIDFVDDSCVLLGSGSYGERIAESYVAVILHEASDGSYWIESDYRDLDRCELIQRILTEYDGIIQSGELADVHSPGNP